MKLFGKKKSKAVAPVCRSFADAKRLLLIINPVSGKLKARASAFDIIEIITDAGFPP